MCCAAAAGAGLCAMAGSRPTSNATAGFRNLSRRHGIKVPVGPEYSVEDCGLAVGEVVGYDSVKAASRMNSAVVIFLDSIDKVNLVVERGIVLRNSHVTVFPLVNPAKKIILSNLPPFISDEMLERELSRHGQIVSAMKMLPSGCKSAKLKHVVSFRRQVYMVLKNDNDELNMAMKFRVDGFDYTIFASTETMKCFGCGQEGHLVRNCPEKAVMEAALPQSAEGAEDTGGRNQVDNEEEQAVAQGPDTETQQDGERATTSAAGFAVQSQTSVEGEEQEEMNIDELLNEEEKIVRDDESAFKVPNPKRKPKMQSEGAKPKKMPVMEKSKVQESDSEDFPESDSEIDLSDSSVLDGQKVNGYSLEQIRSFLELTKGKRDVVVDDFFPNRSMFVESSRWLMNQRGGDGLKNTEVYRLKKLVQKVRAQITNVSKK